MPTYLEYSQAKSVLKICLVYSRASSLETNLPSVIFLFLSQRANINLITTVE
jgi:hypothetical protein